MIGFMKKNAFLNKIQLVLENFSYSVADMRFILHSRIVSQISFALGCKQKPCQMYCGRRFEV